LVILRSIVKSIKGLANAYIKYKLKAIVTKGQLSYNLYTFKLIRIVRTLDLSALERAMLVKNLWANKVKDFIVVSQ
jgi:hypothetical protein